MGIKMILLSIALTTMAATKAGFALDVDGLNVQPSEYEINYYLESVNLLKQYVLGYKGVNFNLFHPRDLQDFQNDEGPVAASQFLNQRNGNVEHAAKLAYEVLEWRKTMLLNQVDASSFPCSLFERDLIFEHGHGHSQLVTGEYVQTNPVIWLRLGALGSIIKQLERITPERLVSYAVNTPRAAWHRARDKISERRERKYKVSYREQRQARREARGPLVRNLSVKDNPTMMHVLRSIAWWIDTWARQHPKHTKAILVLDFENTDYALASWTVSEFLVKLDDRFPNLFELILAYRYKNKNIWEPHVSMSMFNRIFKTTLLSPPETDYKFHFIGESANIDYFMPRVDEKGFNMLPSHIKNDCLPPDPSKAPTGCQKSLPAPGTSSLFDPNVWLAIDNEFRRICNPRD